MALWQFDCMIIPDKNISLDVESDEILSWKEIELLLDIKKVLANILSYSKGWSKDILIYGKEDGTCIKLLFENDTLDEIILRLDLRSLTREMLSIILEFVKSINGHILYSGSIYIADMNAIIPLLKESDAGRFCMNPKDYFEELERKEV